MHDALTSGEIGSSCAASLVVGVTKFCQSWPAVAPHIAQATQCMQHAHNTREGHCGSCAHVHMRNPQPFGFVATARARVPPSATEQHCDSATEDGTTFWFLTSPSGIAIPQ
jgi:hypothetical protein